MTVAVGAIILVRPGDRVPADGEIIEGVASVNEAAITGESAPVIRESGGDRSAVTGGTTVVSDWIKVRITAKPPSDGIVRLAFVGTGTGRDQFGTKGGPEVLEAFKLLLSLCHC